MSAFASYERTPMPTPCTQPALEFARIHGIDIADCKDICKPKVTLDCVRKVLARRNGLNPTGLSRRLAMEETVDADLDTAPVLEENEPQYDYELCCSRSQPRLPTGEIAIECSYDGAPAVKVPLTAFIDKEGWFTDGEVCQWVNDWCAKAKEYPDVRRKCLMCNRKAVKSMVTCGVCDKVWGGVIYAQ